jgi:hypothetical protein
MGFLPGPAPKGNRNALKHGTYTKEALTKANTSWKPHLSPNPDSSPSKNKATGETLPVTSRPPRTDLLEHQLKLVIGNHWVGEMRQRLTRGAIDLYRSLEPQDAIDATWRASSSG